jgi:hypothetical protein
MAVTVTSRSQPRILPVFGTAIAIVLVLVLANRLTATPGPQLAPAKTTVGIAPDKSTPTPKERVRYQATIENWQRYRANPADAR